MQVENNSIREAAAILSKVQRLLAMTTANGCTEHEASVAAVKVQELLAAHNLNLAAMEHMNAAANPESAPVYEKRERQDSGLSATAPWARRLMTCLASNNFCLQFEIEAGKLAKRHGLIGRQVNVTITVQTYQYLVQAMNRLNPYKTDRKNANRFFDGCTDRLVERLRQRRHEQELESWKAREANQQNGNGTGTELILGDVYGSEDDLNNDAAMGWEPGTTAARNRKWRAENAAYRAQEDAYRKAEDQLVADGMDRESAWYVARGREVPQPKTAEQIAQEKRDADEYERRHARRNKQREARWEREAERERLRKENPAYRSGRETAESIGLDQQIDNQGDLFSQRRALN